MFQITDTHYAATWLLDPRAPKVESPIGGKANV
jgi:oligopeptide transport system ATP-binding protein